MDSALAWIGSIADWVGKFFPRWEILDTTAGAIKFVRGSKVKVCGPGIHWYWPATTRFVAYPTARQAEDLRSQTFVTKDDKVIVVGGMIVYEVVNLEPLLAHTYDAPQTIKDISLTVVHDVCCQLTWEELKEQQRNGKLDRALRAEAKKVLEPYGVKVLKMMLTDCAPARVLKLLQSTSAD